MANCPKQDNSPLGENKMIEEISIKDCTKSRLKKSCKCNNEHNSKFRRTLKANKTENIEKVNSIIAKEVFEQLKKNLSSIAIEILSLDSLGLNQEIGSCNLSNLTRNMKSNCNNNSLYSLIENEEEFNIESLHESFNSEIKSYYKDFNRDKSYLVNKKNLSEGGDCSLNDRTALQVSTLVNNGKFTEYLIDWDRTTPLEKLIPTSELERFKSIPYYNKLLTSHELNSEDLSNIPNSLINNSRIKNSLQLSLGNKCKDVYTKAVASLCASDKENSTLNYKDSTRSILKSINETDLESQVQYLDNICNNEKVKDISPALREMNEMLPLNAQKLSSKSITKTNYNNTFHSVRQKICSFIPDQVSSIDEGLIKMGCKGEDFNEDCLFLEAYKKLLDQSKESITDLDTNNNIANVKSTKKSSKSNFIFNKPSALVSSFIAIDPVEDKEENTSLVQKEDVSAQKEVSKVSVTPSVSGNNSKSVNKTFKKQRFKETNKSNQQDVTKEIYYPNHKTVSSNTIQETQKDKEMNDFYKGLAEKIRRSKSQNKYESKSISNSKNLLDRSKRNLNKAKEIMRNIASAQDDTFKSNRESDLDTNYQNDEDIQEMINDQMHADTNFGSSNNYNPSKGNESRTKKGYNSKLSSASLEKGYAYQNIFGDTITKQGIEANYIENKGFQGEIIGDKALEFVFLGELEHDPDKINLDEILTLDNSKGNIDSLLASIDTGKPFFIRSASSPNERILVKPSGGDFEFIKFSDDDSREFNKFYRKVKKAFKKKFYAKIRSKNSVVSASGY